MTDSKEESIVDLAYKGKLDVIRKITSKETINQSDEKKYTALMWAAFRGQNEVVQFLIASNADLNVQNVYGRTALMLSALNGSYAALTMLAQAGADDSIRDKWGESVYEFGDERELVANAVIAGRGGSILYDALREFLPAVLIALILDYFLSTEVPPGGAPGGAGGAPSSPPSSSGGSSEPPGSPSSTPASNSSSSS